jgi:hypothetical protein
MAILGIDFDDLLLQLKRNNIIKVKINSRKNLMKKVFNDCSLIINIFYVKIILRFQTCNTLNINEY